MFELEPTSPFRPLGFGTSVIDRHSFDANPDLTVHHFDPDPDWIRILPQVLHMLDNQGKMLATIHIVS
jgi:hypothetical protein